MTRTIPLRRTILQFSQIRRTLLRTFMACKPFQPVPTGESSIVAGKTVLLKGTVRRVTACGAAL
jgi:hypothetical protein